LVDSKENRKEAIRAMIVYVCGLPLFERKKEMILALYDAEWRLMQ